jgi:hypothetical protein
MTITHGGGFVLGETLSFLDVFLRIYLFFLGQNFIFSLANLYLFFMITLSIK